MNANFRNIAIGAAIAFAPFAILLSLQLAPEQATVDVIPFSRLLHEVDQGHVHGVTIEGPEISGALTDGRSFQSYAPDDPSLVPRLYAKGVSITARARQSQSLIVVLLSSWLPLIAILGVWTVASRHMQGVGGKAFGFGKSRAKLMTETQGRVTFDDVAGVDEARSDLQEIVDFLRTPNKYKELGGRIPRGVLPSTGNDCHAQTASRLAPTHRRIFRSNG